MIASRRILLGDLCEVTVGPSGSLLENLHDNKDGVPVLTPSDLSARREVIRENLRRLSRKEAGQLARFALRQGDVLFVRQGALGRTAVIEPEQTGWLYSSSCLRLRPRSEQVMPTYLALYLSHPPVLAELTGQAPPGTVLWAHASTLRRLPVHVPPLRQQAAVVGTISAIDARIKAEQALLVKLEGLGSAIFENMLGDCDPSTQ
ncbi:restriction endonuclease subunit S [Microbispora sp. H10830]|uniref:restriction endonuclease subunit S n=1 Tax=Microbispora sp. H10830 TaxID=2729109 RepID=UPI0016040DAF|nr:restriction endonuclease subunit S [Microbispora sp. H10830]